MSERVSVHSEHFWWAWSGRGRAWPRADPPCFSMLIYVIMLIYTINGLIVPCPETITFYFPVFFHYFLLFFHCFLQVLYRCIFRKVCVIPFAYFFLLKIVFNGKGERLMQKGRGLLSCYCLLLIINNRLIGETGQLALSKIVSVDAWQPAELPLCFLFCLVDYFQIYLRDSKILGE